MRYDPNPVPESHDQAYLQQELQRIADAINAKPDRSFGGLIQQVGPVIIPLTPTPIIFNPYDQVLPLVGAPDNVEANLTTGELTVLTGGAYVVQFFSLDDDVANNTSYNFTPTINGVRQSITAGINPSNQTNRVPVSLAAIVELVKGDVVAIEADSPSSSTWDAVGSRFILHRVSDTFD